MVVEQSADEGVLFFRQRIDARLAIDESPPLRLTIHSLAGSFKELDSTYQLTRMAAGTLIEYRARLIPDFRLPPLIGMYAVQASLERHLGALAQEMVRRSADAETPRERAATPGE